MAALLTSLGISIHAPREGGDSHSSPGRVVHSLFQSTPPARGATSTKKTPPKNDGFQSTPPARGATEKIIVTGPIASQFTPTPPARGATEETSRGSAVGKISIHAPREGGDD